MIMVMMMMITMMMIIVVMRMIIITMMIMIMMMFVLRWEGRNTDDCFSPLCVVKCVLRVPA